MHNNIELWFVDPEIADQHALLQVSRGLLSDEELARGERFRFATDRRDYLITRWLVRTILSEKLAVPAQAIRFGTNAYGRPYVLDYPELSFNISHTSGLIALAIAQAGEVGIDVERLHTGRATLQLAEYCFAASERAALRGISPADLDEAFFSYWTLKECYIKALGMGLSIGLETFSIELGDDKSIGFTPPVGVSEACVPHFWLLRPVSGYLCAICARVYAQPYSLKAWNVVPLTCTTALDVTVLRRSTM